MTPTDLMGKIPNMTHLASLDFEEETHPKRVVYSKLLPSPIDIITQLACPLDIKQFILKKRHEISSIIHGRDDRLLTIIGPCSIHNVDEAIEYAKRLTAVVQQYESTLVIVMRVYLEKPRTTVGWKGLIHDPYLDGTNDINHGLKISRQLLLNINSLGLACACELLQPLITYYISDLISWGAIGARTAESQVHREFVSGLNMPIGFKNGTTGCIQMAIDACVASRMKHSLLSISHHGNIVHCETSGNDDLHVVLRGGSMNGPNYSSEHVMKTRKLLNESHIKTKIMIDCSHGNSMKNVEQQKYVIGDVCNQVAYGDRTIIGVMVESNLVSGSQPLIEGGKHLLQYGKSITDSCIGWDATMLQLQLLSDSVYQRRRHND
ncbi:unnamed protein product [Rotaria socialis]|nr:unnamed protein product [Rotaria socialis]